MGILDTRIYKAILSQAIVDALYIPSKKDKEVEDEYYKKELAFKERSSKLKFKKKQYQRSPPKRLQNEMAFKRDALKWLYGHNKDDLWILDLCCDICEVTQSQIIKIIESTHESDDYNVMCKTNFSLDELIIFKKVDKVI